MGFCINSLTGRKMKSIERLPEAIHNSVRSGIVICDLARIVEELVFNSIDAGSTKVSVAVGVGNYYVKVDDNEIWFYTGRIVAPGRKIWSLVEVSTSKIDHSALMDTGSENLDFHGEALCSISDASLLEIVTKARGKPNGYRKIMKNSKCVFLEIYDDRQDVGTTVVFRYFKNYSGFVLFAVTVRDIFYNQPVRRKHMKSSPKKVLDSIKLSVLRIALVHLNVSFKVLDVESADVLLLTGTSSSPLPILSSYFGIENSVTFHKLDLSDGELKLAGYISDPRGFLSPKAIQYVCIHIMVLMLFSGGFLRKIEILGPIYKLLNHLAAKFDSLSFGQPATTSCQSEKRNKYDMCPMFILNLHCPRSYYDIFTSDRTSVEFKAEKKYHGAFLFYLQYAMGLNPTRGHVSCDTAVCRDWGPVLALIESGVMRLWTENISPVTSDKDMADTFGRGKKRCRKLNFQTPLYLESPRQKKLRNNYDYMPDLEGWASRYGELFRKASQLNKNPKEADLLSEMDYQNQLHGGYVADYVVTTNAEVRNNPSPCGAAYTFGNDEDSISSTLENNLLAFDAKIFDLSTVSGVVADCFKFSDYAHLDQEPSRNFLRSCSFGRSLLHERNSSPTDERFQLGRNGIRVEKEWNDCDDSMDDKTDLAMCGRDLHRKEASQSPVTQYDMHETLESPIWDSVKTSLVFGNISPDSSKLGCKWTPGLHCFRPGWSPLTPEKDIGNKFLDDDDEASYKNLIEGCSELYSPQREGEHKCSFMNLSPDSKSGNGEFRWGDFENMFSPKSSKRIRETNWSDLRLYGEESPRNYSVPASHECEKSNIRNQNTILDNKKIFRRSLSAPLFHRRKTRYMDLTNSSTMSSAKSTSQNTSATLPSTEPGDSSCRKLHSETRNLKCSQTSFGQCHSSPIERPVIDCSIAERPILKITPEVITFENGGPQENGQFGNMEIVECLHSTGIRDPLNTRCKWRNYFLPSAGGSRSDNKNEQHIILDISDFLHLAGDPLTPKSIDRTSLEDAKVLNQVDKKFIAVVAGKTLAMIDQHAADERIKLEDLRLKVLSGKMKTITYLDADQEMVLPEIGYQLLQNYAAQVQSWGWICNIPSRDTSSFSKHMDFLHRQQTVVKLLAQAIMVPCILGVSLTDIDLLEFLQQLSDTDGSSTIPSSIHRVLNNKACRGAIMFGDTLLPSECSLIVDELKRTSLCFQCAHGRPTTVPLVNLDLLHNRIANLGSPQPWHGLCQNNKPSLEHIFQHLSSAP
ncbi:hypothetical protein OROHE_007129 [Orobanche hederae]